MNVRNFFRNICIGLVDGLTIPLALAAGLSGLANKNSPVIIACFAAAVAGAFTMTIGGYFESKKYSSGVKPSVAGLTIGTGYLVGGIITTVPYYFVASPLIALQYSVIATLTVLFVAGYWESKLNGGTGWANAARVCVTGAAAAGVAFYIAKLFV
ncbi:MAG: VIT1/CCC1 transporter family protein [Chitinophagaceae bacterium]|nr:VIT1/CCC1 transporter family protein [Chitinophagaceae bacterium]